MALFKRGIIDRIFFFANYVGRERDDVALVAHLDAQAKVFRNEVGKTARLLVTFPADHCSVPEHGRKPVIVLHRLIGRPMRIDADVEQLHKKVAVAGGDVIRLHDADIFVRIKIPQTGDDKIRRDDFV